MSLEQKELDVRDLVREVYPKATNDDCGRLLWGCTSFPFGSPKEEVSDADWYRQQLSHVHDRVGDDIEKSLGFTWDEIGEALRASEQSTQ